MATDQGTQRPLGSATIISRRRFLKQTATATAVVAVPYLADKSVAFGKDKAKGAVPRSIARWRNSSPWKAAHPASSP